MEEKKIFHLKRVPYGKEDTLIEDREYHVKELNNSAVGTIKEIKVYLKNNNISNFELMVEDKGGINDISK